MAHPQYIMVKKRLMMIISPEIWVNRGLEEGEYKCGKSTVLDVKEAKASLIDSPVQDLLLWFLEHVGVNEGFSLACEIFHIGDPRINYIAPIVEFTVGEAIYTVSSKVKRHKPTPLPGSNSISHPLLQNVAIGLTSGRVGCHEGDSQEIKVVRQSKEVKGDHGLSK